MLKRAIDRNIAAFAVHHREGNRGQEGFMVLLKNAGIREGVASCLPYSRDKRSRPVN